LTTKEFWAAYQELPEFQPHSSSLNLVLDDTPFHVVNIYSTAPGFAEVDVKLDDNG
jgi:hypothetical protein